MKSKEKVLWLKQVGLNDIEIAGGKNASLGEMISNLSQLGVRIPNGFVITVIAFKEFLTFNFLDEKIRLIVNQTDFNDLTQLRECGEKVRDMISSGQFPQDLAEKVSNIYIELSSQYKTENIDVAVRSSAILEDLPNASFAGQQDTYLNISGIPMLLDSVKKCFASLFTDRAISYRESLGFDQLKNGLSVCVQKMVRSDLASSGVAFSLDTESGFKDAIIINGSYGLGELIVQGAISPDEFIAFKPSLKSGFEPIIERKLGRKDKKLIYGGLAQRVTEVPTTELEQASFSITNQVAAEIADWVLLIEDYYSSVKKQWCPVDVEWAVDGISQKVYIVQARPETVHSRTNRNSLIDYSITDTDIEGRKILDGIAVGNKIASGMIRIMHATDKDSISDAAFEAGDILVTDMTDPHWEPLMKKAAAIITNKGGRTCHAAIIAREMGLPALVGCINATEVLSDGHVVTVSCAEGEVGHVYTGSLTVEKKEWNLDELPDIETALMLNVASPENAFHLSKFPNSGIGLAREEFIINNYIKVHPMALINHHNLEDEKLRDDISGIIKGYNSGSEFFVEKLSSGVARIAASFYPNDVIVRFSDFKTNEYYNLLGGKYYEPKEENPMMGWRGASRYYSKKYKEAFGLECLALKKVRMDMGLTNVIVMIPFCRTVNELLQVYAVMEEYGLKRGTDGLKVYLMAEVPSNVIMADQFAAHIDGFSIGSNDLTQLVLGLDRDSELVSHLYDERDPAVKEMIRQLIAAAKKAGIKVGICGQGPSDFPDFAQFLVEQGIDSISVTPDSLVKTIHAIHSIEEIRRLEKAKIPIGIENDE